MTNSRIPGFYNLTLDERRAKLADASHLSPGELTLLTSPLATDIASHMVENAIGTFSLPLGIALNFTVNGRDVLVPMVIEEPSVVAGASFMAKLARSNGGFTATSSEPLMIGQLQVLDVEDLHQAAEQVLARKAELLTYVDEAESSLKSRGGGARDLEVRVIEESPIGKFLVVHLIYDVRDAMGANAVNTACERLAPKIEEITGGRVHLKILSNLTDKRMAKATCVIPVKELEIVGRDGIPPYSSEEVRDGIIAAYAFAAADPYRAATHNKGIMNGIDPVVIATGNDWRAVEAGAHAYAARNGKYASLSVWSKDADGNLVGELEMPLAVGIVGGATKVHPAAQAALKLMGVKTARELAEIIVCVGLAQNMAALRALATEGIQRGHMSLHARQVAIAAGASGEFIEKVASQMAAEGIVRIERAKEILKAMESGKKKEESTFWKSQGPLVGALIGIFIFLVVFLPLKFLDYNSIFLYKLALNLELFGRLTVLMLGTASRINLPAGAIKLVSIAVSAIPAGIAGWQIGSRNPSTRKTGFVFLAGYLLFIYAFGKLLAFAGV